MELSIEPHIICSNCRMHCASVCIMPSHHSRVSRWRCNLCGLPHSLARALQPFRALVLDSAAVERRTSALRPQRPSCRDDRMQITAMMQQIESISVASADDVDTTDKSSLQPTYSDVTRAAYNTCSRDKARPGGFWRGGLSGAIVRRV